jgi:hypothetical protein
MLDPIVNHYTPFLRPFPCRSQAKYCFRRGDRKTKFQKVLRRVCVSTNIGRFRSHHIMEMVE